MQMNRVRYKMMQDFLHVVLMGLVVGVLFSMAVSGVVFLVSGQAGNANHPVQTQPGGTEAKRQVSGARSTSAVFAPVSALQARSTRI
jgi:hypothetical protein